MKNKIKFHSIYYRYILFICLFALLTFYSISNGQPFTLNLFEKSFLIEWQQVGYMTLIIFITVAVIVSLINWKFYICKDGIFLRKINLFITWDEMIAVSHIWINKIDSSLPSDFSLYNAKTVVIHRKHYKPICIYNISLLALYIVKIYNPKIKTNIVSATLATAFNIVLNAWVLYEAYSMHIRIMSSNTFVILIGLYAFKIFIPPFLMVRQQNKLYGSALSHDRGNKRNCSEAIHL